jgi:hypothetical protein
VCSGGTSSDLTTINEDVFSNFDFMYLPCCLPPNISCEEGGSLKGWVQKRTAYFMIALKCQSVTAEEYSQYHDKKDNHLPLPLLLNFTSCFPTKLKQATWRIIQLSQSITMFCVTSLTL